MEERAWPLRRRGNGDGALQQTKDGRGRATVGPAGAKGARQREYPSGPTRAAVSRSAPEAPGPGSGLGCGRGYSRCRVGTAAAVGGLPASAGCPRSRHRTGPCGPRTSRAAQSSWAQARAALGLPLGRLDTANVQPRDRTTANTGAQLQPSDLRKHTGVNVQERPALDYGSRGCRFESCRAHYKTAGQRGRSESGGPLFAPRTATAMIKLFRQVPREAPGVVAGGAASRRRTPALPRS